MKDDKSEKMLQAEKVLGRPLEEGLAELVTLHGLSGAAKYLNVSVGVLKYWLKVFRVTTAYIAISPQDSLIITRGDGEKKELIGVGS